MANITGDSRFGISALSKSNQAIAYREELMVDKTTGEMLVKTPEGDVISYDYISRLKAHVDRATMNCYNFQMKGKMFLCELNDIQYPYRAQFSENIVKSSTIYLTTAKKFMLSFDVDTVPYAVDKVIQERYIPNIICTIKVKTDVGDAVFDINETCESLSTRIYTVASMLPKGALFTTISIELASVKIARNDTLPDGMIRNILHSVIITLDE